MTPQEQSRRFYACVWPHRAALLRMARLLTRSADAEDLTQETLMRAFRKIEQFNVESNALAWLTGILRHARIDQTRLRGHMLMATAAHLDFQPAEPESEPSAADSHELAALLETLSDERMIDAMLALPEDIRWSVLLVDVQQMTYDDAANIMDVPAGTAKSRVFRGRSMLKTSLLAMQRAQGQPMEKRA